MLPKTTSELDLHDMFARYGQLKEVCTVSMIHFPHPRLVDCVNNITYIYNIYL
jgi:hypothetical protein